ncbi:MAG: S8 family serine peptidase [Phycisphaerales bacterium]|nr:S8 family serine peptidase [Phycisphaerales bacterium]
MISTFVFDETHDPPGTEYGFMDEIAAGSSWASPQVAGIVALMLGVNPALTFEDVKYILEVTATDIGVPGYDQWTGAGLVNARKAVEYVMKYALPADWNGDGNIETLDAALYLIDYTNAHAMTDLNLDAVQTTDDVTIFLNSYAGE